MSLQIHSFMHHDDGFAIRIKIQVPQTAKASKKQSLCLRIDTVCQATKAVDTQIYRCDLHQDAENSATPLRKNALLVRACM